MLAKIPALARGTLFLLTVTAGVLATPTAGTLDIYWIDVEGGASTLVVTPQGQSVLMDAGYGGFGEGDASRIEQVVVKEAGLKRLDYVVISHFHPDHVGGLAALAKRVEIGAFVDHGESVEKDASGSPALWNDYRALAGGRQRTVKPGDRLALSGVEFLFVAGNGEVLSSPLAGAASNDRCASFTAQPEDRGQRVRDLILDVSKDQAAAFAEIA